MYTRYRRKAFTEKLPIDRPGIVDVFIGRYQAIAIAPLFASRSLPSNGSIRHNINRGYCRCFFCLRKYAYTIAMYSASGKARNVRTAEEFYKIY
jgi:hypothetical protein